MRTFCPYCKCLIKLNGYCRNEKCILGNNKQCTLNQQMKISELCEELEIDISGKDFDKLTKEKASTLISKLIKRKVNSELYKEATYGNNT